MHEMQSGLPSNRQYRLYNRYVKNYTEAVAIKKYGVKFAFKADLIKYTARANLLASVYSAATAGIDCYYAFKRGDAGAATGLAVATAGFIMTAAETLPTILISIGRGVLLNPLSKLGIAGLLVVFIGYAIYYIFKDEPLEAWLRASPWGDEPYGGGDKDWIGDNPYYCWQEQPDYALHDLYQLLFAPIVIGKVSKINIYGHNKQGREGEIEFGHFNVQIPGHMPGNGSENIAMEIAIRPSSTTNKWHVLNASAKEGVVKTAQDVFWDGVNITLNQGNTGFQLSFHEKCLYPYFDEYQCEKLDVRMRYRSYPKGKGATITPTSKQELRLPLGTRDEQGELEQPNVWAEDTISLHIHDFGKGTGSWLSSSMHKHEKTTY